MCDIIRDKHLGSTDSPVEISRNVILKKKRDRQINRVSQTSRFTVIREKKNASHHDEVTVLIATL